MNIVDVDVVSMFITVGSSLLAVWKFIKSAKAELNEVFEEAYKQRLSNEAFCKQVDELMRAVNKQSETLSDLVESDKSRIRSEITQEYRRCTKQGFIEPHTLDYITKQYECYTHEGGNSYITKLMEDLAELRVKETNEDN